MSYSGGTSRGIELAREFEKLGYLRELFIPRYNQRDIRNIRKSIPVFLLKAVMFRSRRIRRAKPTERYWTCEAHDRWVARNLKPGADILLAEGQIALHSIRRAKQLGMVTVVDRTNSHIAHQSEICDEENRKLGIKWSTNSMRVIRKGIREYEEADYTFVLSSFVARSFLDQGYPREKLLHVLPGIDLRPFRQIEKDDKTFRVLYCGWACGKKGTHYLLQAFSELKLNDAELWLIGGIAEEMLPFLEKYKGSYKAMGHINRSELYKYYSQGNVFVLPSIEEGLAKVTIEAMACGLPVIATANTGAEDVIRKGVDGFIVPIRDIDALKEKIIYMYENQNMCREMGQNAKERVHAEFTLEQYLDRMLTAFAKIIP
jgi:glycosyltransferase involved in cell wall biosynthesis